jgi:septal ring factor EnvC (AmiA/AmiB activator)
MNPFFNWLKDSGTQALLILLGTIAACIAAIAAIYYGRKSLSREDLAPIEKNTGGTSSKLLNVETHLSEMKEDMRRVKDHTAETSGHLESVHSEIKRLNERMAKEPEREALCSLAIRVMPRIVGAIEREAPTAIFTISTDDANVTFTRVDLVSENRSLVHSVECEMKSYPNMQQAIVSVDGATFRKWLDTGTKMGGLGWTAYLTVYLAIKGHAGEADLWRKISVHLENPSAVYPPRNGPWIYRLEGRL